MKNVLCFILLVSLAPFAQADVTLQQVQQAQACSRAIFNCAVDLQGYADNVRRRFEENFSFTILGASDPVPIPQTVKNEIVNVQVYQAKKQACVDAYNTCP